MTFRNALLRVGRPISSLVGRLFFVLFACGCTSPVPRHALDSAVTMPAVELHATAFFPQAEYQCGPAALATALTAAGQPVSPEQLVSQVYLPQREGSLQIEMLATARRNGAIAFVLEPDLRALLVELEAGRPVIVLQNLAFTWAPRWHYAVAIGYNLPRNEIILRSGLEERLVMTIATFWRTWRGSGQWAMVALRPGDGPVIADESRYLEAVIAFEKASPPGSAWPAYREATDRWPQNALAWMGLGNSAFQTHRMMEAEEAFRRSAQFAKDPAPALNNLALVLEAQGRYDEAVQTAQAAVRAGGPFHDTAQATLDRLQKLESAPQ